MGYKQDLTNPERGTTDNNINMSFGDTSSIEISVPPNRTPSAAEEGPSRVEILASSWISRSLSFACDPVDDMTSDQSLQQFTENDYEIKALKIIEEIQEPWYKGLSGDYFCGSIEVHSISRRRLFLMPRISPDSYERMRKIWWGELCFRGFLCSTSILIKEPSCSVETYFGTSTRIPAISLLGGEHIRGLGILRLLTLVSRSGISFKVRLGAVLLQGTGWRLRDHETLWKTKVDGMNTGGEFSMEIYQTRSEFVILVRFMLLSEA